MTSYTYYLRIAGQAVGPDIEVELDCNISLCSGEPEVIVRAVWIDGKDILQSDSEATYLVACDIKAEAEADRDFCERAIAEAGCRFTGRGANDPSGRWREAAE